MDCILINLFYRNSTATPVTYWGQFEEIGQYNPSLNVAERLWAAWYAWMQNDVLATGIMSFMMHELVYFGRSLPWIFIDSMGLFKGYKIQSVRILTDPNIDFLHRGIFNKSFTDLVSDRAKFLPCVNNGIVPNSSF